uniref:Zn-finger protein n=1 Tax=Pithovirus LCPAC403 TaxID=2506596 RepID=A0A481ZB19_9VIRU|nr:MAG: uncharacterized protein LCPAC403_01110 [Pithovirus LCPAC403]
MVTMRSIIYTGKKSNNNLQNVTEKICAECSLLKLLTEFHKYVNGEYGRQSTCKKCRKTNNYPRLTEGTKKCSKCKEEKDVLAFNSDKALTSGLQSQCRECQNSLNYFRQKSGTKKCVKCGKEKDVLEFNSHKQQKSGLQPRCRKCQNSSNYLRQKEGTKKCSKCGNEKDVAEFNSNKRLTSGLRSDCRKCQNSYNYPRQTEGTKKCSECGENKDVSKFNTNKGLTSGLQSKCRECYKASARYYSRKTVGTKRCFDCKKIKDVSMMSSKSTTRDGLSHLCKTCTNIRGARRLSNFDKYMNDLYIHVKSRSKSDNICMDISKESMINLCDDQCMICPGTGHKLLHKKTTQEEEDNSHYYNISCDRIDSKQGYIEYNVQFTTKGYNQIKNEFDEDLIFKICRKIQSFQPYDDSYKKIKIGPTEKRFIRNRFNDAKYHCVRGSREIIFLITEKQIQLMYIKQEGLCYLSGIEMTLVKGRRTNEDRHRIKANYFNLSIDRIDSSKDYTIDNVHVST